MHKRLTHLASAVPLAIAIAVAPLAAQDPDDVGRAIAASCGLVDESIQGVLAGTVRDAESGVPLGGAAVVIRWQLPGANLPGSRAVRTDGDGFFLFCDAPGGVAVYLTAEVLEERSAPVTVGIDSGTLVVEHLQVELSDPRSPGFVTGLVMDGTSRKGIARAVIRIRDTDVSTLLIGCKLRRPSAPKSTRSKKYFVVKRLLIF